MKIKIYILLSIKYKYKKCHITNISFSSWNYCKTISIIVGVEISGLGVSHRKFYNTLGASCWVVSFTGPDSLAPDIQTRCI